MPYFSTKEKEVNNLLPIFRVVLANFKQEAWTVLIVLMNRNEEV